MKINIARYTHGVLFWMLLLGALLPMSEAEAQQDSQFTQYMYNTQTINPAYAGTRGVTSFTGLFRTQWVGLDGAPETFNFSGSTPMGESGRTGLGLSFISDKIGPSSEQTITADFSYTLQLNEQGTLLSFGLKGGINLLDVDYSKLLIHDPLDPQFQFNIDNRLTPIIGTGAYLHTQKWYLGLSVPNLLQTTHYDDTTVSNANERANFYLMGGYVFPIGDSVQFKPAALVKMVSGAPLGVDISANFLFSERFTLGASYRLDAAVSGLAGFQISQGILIGYGYDYDVSDLGNYNSGSHEIFLRFELGGSDGTERLLSPRFF